MRGTQEEQTATEMSLIGAFARAGRPRQGNGRMDYKSGYALLPGHASFAETNILDGREPPMRCTAVSVAFADFRTRSPESEGRDFVEGTPEYKQRIALDIHVALRTAILHGQRRTVLAAGGCGAFQHRPAVDAEIWREVISEYREYFDEITFAIKGGSRAFEGEFRDPLV